MSDLIRIRNTCRLCSSSRIVCSIPLAEVPIVSPNVGTQDSVSSQTDLVAPLDSYLCLDCGLIQLVHLVDPAAIYANYLYRTSISLGLAEHFRVLSETVCARLRLTRGDLVVEFGSNDGTLLGFFKACGQRVQGIDPARAIAAEASQRGIPTMADFFGTRVARALRQNGPARAILANNVMANIDGLDDVFAGVETLLADDGAFVFETQYALDVFEKTLVDVIYHEHISCFSVRPVAAIARRFGLEVFDAERITTKGGSIRFWLQKLGGIRPISANVGALIDLETRAGIYDLAAHSAFSARLEAIESALHSAIDAARVGGRTIAAYGTSVGCVTLINQFKLAGKLDFLIDDNPLKRELRAPNYALEVCGPDDVGARNPALILVLAWRYASAIARKHPAYLRAGGKFVVPLPEVRVLDLEFFDNEA